MIKSLLLFTFAKQRKPKAPQSPSDNEILPFHSSALANCLSRFGQTNPLGCWMSHASPFMDEITGSCIQGETWTGGRSLHRKPLKGASVSATESEYPVSPYGR